MAGFRGRCPFRQYIASKPDKYGMKMWVLCDARNNYQFNTQPYLGKQSESVERQQPLRVLLDMVRPLSPGHNVTTDNLFTSVAAAENLHALGHTLVGTMRKNKPDIPDCFKSAITATTTVSSEGSLSGSSDDRTLFVSANASRSSGGTMFVSANASSLDREAMQISSSGTLGNLTLEVSRNESRGSERQTASGMSRARLHASDSTESATLHVSSNSTSASERQSTSGMSRARLQASRNATIDRMTRATSGSGRATLPSSVSVSNSNSGSVGERARATLPSSVSVSNSNSGSVGERASAAATVSSLGSVTERRLINSTRNSIRMRERPLHSTLFGFSEYITIAS
ncbi:piggyBac transposable element-derived protein 4-like protein, partial [Dinothrombium tinctorium]